MTELSRLETNLPPEQQAIRAKCFHPSRTFVEFKKEEIEQSIPDRFEKIVGKYPERIAVKTRNHTLCYDAVNKAANRMARAILRERGDGAEPVALLLDHEAPMIAAILGVLKAGKFYVPLDPTHPQSRLACLLEDSQAALIVTNNKHLSLTMELASKNYSSLNIDELGDAPTENLSLTISPDRLAYMRYTSGSTGEPKGVLEKHRNLLHVVMQETNAFHLCADDRLTFLGSWGKHIFRGLLTGASLFPANVKEEGLGYLAKWLAEEEITSLHSTSTLFRHIVDTFTGEDTFPALRLVRLAGEPVLKRDVESYKNHFSSQCILVNELASTEAGGITAYFIDKQTETTSDIVPVGYALDDVKVLLLNDEGKNVRFDEIGEIAVQSRYFFSGYWRKPELTRAAFLTDPEGGDEQIFLTGDLGVMCSDGCVEHRGRKDFRVKIRGLRVELEEVEAVLRQHAAVQEAVILAREDEASDERLVAYVAPRVGQTPGINELRSFLKARLPGYMVPSAFLIVEVLPLTPNGKVDRRALPDPGKSRPEIDAPYVSPRTAVEEALVTIWAGVLSLDQVGIHDNFFDLGGHSLSATRVVSRVIQTFQLEIPLQALFQAPTVADMAAVITESQAKSLDAVELNQIVAELESLSDEEAQRLLADANKTNSTTNRHE